MSGLTRAISRSTTRDIESSTNALIRNLGGGGGGGGPAAVDYAGISYAGRGDGSSSVAVSHESTADHQGFLVVATHFYSATASTVSTWDGVAPTEVYYSTGGIDIADVVIRVWAVMNPAEQTANITITNPVTNRPCSVLVIPFTSLDTSSAATDVFEVSGSWIDPLSPKITGFTCSGTADRLHLMISGASNGDAIPNSIILANSEYTQRFTQSSANATGNNGVTSDVWDAPQVEDSGLSYTSTVFDESVGVIFAVGG